MLPSCGSQENGLSANTHPLATPWPYADMTTLLDNRFAPITFNLGFVECQFDRFSHALIVTQEQIYTRFGIRAASHRFHAPLAGALSKLDPLTSPADSYLLIETGSSWTAVFGNGFDSNNLLNPMSNVLRILECTGLEVVCVPDRGDKTAKDAFRPYGHFSFTLHRWRQSHPTTRIRHVSVTRAAKEWKFRSEGIVQAFEQPESYQKQDIAKRLTAEMLGAYCARLDIQPFDPGFYGARCLLSHCNRRTLPVPRMTLLEAQSRLYL